MNVEGPDTFNCLVNNVGPVTVVIPPKVERPTTSKFSEILVVSSSDTPSTSKSPSISTEFLNELYLIPGSTLNISPSVLVEFSTNGKKKN